MKAGRCETVCTHHPPRLQPLGYRPRLLNHVLADQRIQARSQAGKVEVAWVHLSDLRREFAQTAIYDCIVVYNMLPGSALGEGLVAVIVPCAGLECRRSSDIIHSSIKNAG